jgi:hypothetical protein
MQASSEELGDHVEHRADDLADDLEKQTHSATTVVKDECTIGALALSPTDHSGVGVCCGAGSGPCGLGFFLSATTAEMVMMTPNTS